MQYRHYETRQERKFQKFQSLIECSKLSEMLTEQFIEEKDSNVLTSLFPFPWLTLQSAVSFQ